MIEVITLCLYGVAVVICIYMLLLVAIGFDIDDE